MTFLLSLLAAILVAGAPVLAGAPGESPPRGAEIDSSSGPASDVVSPPTRGADPVAGLAAGTTEPPDLVESPAVVRPPTPRSARTRVPLFRVQRNKNRNEVRYWIDVDRDCRPIGREPVGNHWLKLESGPDVVRSLTTFQQTAYGFRSQRSDGDSVVVELRAVPERPMRIVLDDSADDCSARTSIVIDGRPAWLERVWVEARERLFGVIPDVQYIDLHGRDSDGGVVVERLQR